MKKGDVGLALLVQADGKTKYRPVVLLRVMPAFGDFLVCGVSTQLQQEVAGFDEAIKSTDPDFPRSGLKADSIIRLGFLAVLPTSNFAGSIGSVSAKRHKALLKRLSDFLRPSSV